MKRPRRIATPALCLLLLGQSPHCPRTYYVDYRFDLEGCPGETFQLPDSAVQPEYQLRSTRRKPDPSCSGFKVYDYWEDQKGFAVPDVGQPNVYVRFERGAPCRLHVVLVAIPERNWDPTPWAMAIARLVMGDSTGQLRLPPTTTDTIGNRDFLERWCARQRASAPGSIVASGSRTCAPDPL